MSVKSILKRILGVFLLILGILCAYSLIRFPLDVGSFVFSFRGFLPMILFAFIGYQSLKHGYYLLKGTSRQPLTAPSGESKVYGNSVKDIHKQYSEMTDDELSELKPGDLTESALEYYVDEIKRRKKLPNDNLEINRTILADFKSNEDIHKAVEYPDHVMTKHCPKCAEVIKLEAIICRFCKHEFDETDVQKKIKELEARKEEERNNLEEEIKRKEESIQAQKTLKMKKAARIKMNMQYGLCALMVVIFFFIGGFSGILLILLVNNGDLAAAFVWSLFLFFFILASILMYRKAKKIKSDLTNVIKEIEEFTVALSK